LLLIGLLTKEKAEIIMKCLYKLCDSNHDGFLTETEVVSVLSIFMMMDINSDEKEQQIKQIMVETKDRVHKAFAGKTQVSEQEFYELCTKNEAIKELNDMLRGILSVSLLCGMEPFK
jgi:Ca2+-binding EF-hand superfamily protein